MRVKIALTLVGVTAFLVPAMGFHNLASLKGISLFPFSPKAGVTVSTDWKKVDVTYWIDTEFDRTLMALEIEKRGVYYQGPKRLKEVPAVVFVRHDVLLLTVLLVMVPAVAADYTLIRKRNSWQNPR